MRGVDMTPGGAALAPEPDGVRVVGCGRHDLVRRVPDALADAFKPGSTAPVAALVDARALDAGDPAGHACLRGLGRGELAAAAAGGAAAACAAIRPRRVDMTWPETAPTVKNFLMLLSPSLPLSQLSFFSPSILLFSLYFFSSLSSCARINDCGHEGERKKK